MKNEMVSSNYLNRKRKKCWVFEAIERGHRQIDKGDKTKSRDRAQGPWCGYLHLISSAAQSNT